MEEVILWGISYDKNDFALVFIATSYVIPLNTNIILDDF